MQQIYALLAFSAGVFVPNFYWFTPGYSSLVPAAIVLGSLFYCFRRFWLISLLAGLFYGTLSALSYSQLLLPDELNNQHFLVEAEILGLPEQGERSWRLDVLTHSLRPLTAQPEIEFFDPAKPRKLRLGYYGKLQQPLNPGDRLVFEARLRRPHGLMNLGLFDYQRWLVGEGIHSTGYISRLTGHSKSEKTNWRSGIDRWRQERSGQLQTAPVLWPGVQAALAVGDRRFVDADTWDLFVDTGVVHLMVISGLHVGFVAAMGYFLGRWLLTLCFLQLGINSHRWANLVAVMAVFGYAALAGFSTPTVRALVMISALLLPRFLFLRTSPWWGLSLALALVAILDPRAVLQNGFWLSFLAVVLIFLSISQTIRESFWRGLIRLQLVFLIGFSGVILLVQGYLNPLGFVANLIAVPLTSLLVVPLEILGLLFGLLSETLGLFFWKIAGRILDFMIFLLSWISQLSDWRLQRQELPTSLSLISALSGFCLFIWKKWWQKALGLILLLPLFVPLFEEDFLLELRVFDVGQGLAVLVRQPGYSLLYDAGPKFSESFDAGADILLPSIRRLGINQIDDLVISHPDADHLGGYQGLQGAVNVGRLWGGRQFGQTGQVIDCLQGQEWRVGAVEYRFLSPLHADRGPELEADNDRSCVLQIRFGNQSILMPGDIGRSVERRLLDQALLEPQTLVLIPHHGSKSSSSAAFVRATDPQIAIASAGYLNRFGHPVEEVMDRYRQQETRLFTTSETGMVQVLWRDNRGSGPGHDQGRDRDLIPAIETQAERLIFWWQK